MRSPGHQEVEYGEREDESDVDQLPVTDSAHVVRHSRPESAQLVGHQLQHRHREPHHSPDVTSPNQAC